MCIRDRSLTLRAVFPNPHGDLLPGMFVRARLDEGVRPHALLVPQQGLTRNARGEATVLVVGVDDRVENKIVNAAQAIGSHWLVTGGLSAGDRVIVSGLQMCIRDSCCTGDVPFAESIGTIPVAYGTNFEC